MAASDSDTQAAADPRTDLVATQTEDGNVLVYDPARDGDAAASGAWLQASPDDCVDLTGAR